MHLLAWWLEVNCWRTLVMLCAAWMSFLEIKKLKGICNVQTVSPCPNIKDISLNKIELHDIKPVASSDNKLKYHYLQGNEQRKIKD